MKLENFGYNKKIDAFRIEHNLDVSSIGRIISVHKERYIVQTENDEYDAEITGVMRFEATSRQDFPAVGDWVSVIICDAHFAIINTILPRLSIISRQAVGQFGAIQIIATNIDYAFIIQAVDRDFNINRLERYLTICYSSKVEPIIVLTKTDLIDIDTRDAILGSISHRLGSIPVFAISNENRYGYDALKATIEKGKTYCMLGSSGVGKSTLMNNLSERDVMKTDTISTSTNKGRHITSYRELIVLKNGGILIDNPGMREVGIVDTADGLEKTFATIADFSVQCKFKDCTHTTEKGCAVLDALDKGLIDIRAYESFLKMKKEKIYFESSVEERRKKDKDFGKMQKQYKKNSVC